MLRWLKRPPRYNPSPPPAPVTEEETRLVVADNRERLIRVEERVYALSWFMSVSTPVVGGAVVAILIRVMT